MSMRDLISAGIDQAFVALDDVPVAAILRQYAIVKDDSTAIDTRTPTDIPMTGLVVDQYSSYEAGTSNSAGEGRDVRVTDFKGIVRQNQVAAMPKEGDDVVLNTILYRVMWVGKDPADITWELQLRAH